MNTTPIRLAIIGMGTVGTGIVKLLQDNGEHIAQRFGRPLKLTHVGTRRHRDDLPADVIQSADLLMIASCLDIDIVIETMGGTTVAQEVILHAIKHKKHVVTANKALLAAYGNRLFAAADKAGVCLAYEGAVAGGIPIIKALRESLAANRIQWVAGIINGTNNYIVSSMANDSQPLADALRSAQQLGYAEANPSFDIEGIDAAHKLALLASIAFDIPLQLNKVSRTGIDGLSIQDMHHAKELGYTIKHLALAITRQTGIELRVHPTLIPSSALLAGVNGVKNAVMVVAHPLGETLYYGDGAGAGATSSAVMADVLDVAHLIDNNNRPSPQAFGKAQIDTAQSYPILAADDHYSAYYLRLTVSGNTDPVADISSIMHHHSISIHTLVQKPRADGTLSVIILTQPTYAKRLLHAKADIAALDYLQTPVVCLHLEHLGLQC